MKNSKLVLFFCLFTNFVMLAQGPGDTDGTPTDNLEGTDPAASINHYLIVLALLGGLYAMLALKNKLKTNSNL